jgi:hypothetical protein
MLLIQVTTRGQTGECAFCLQRGAAANKVLRPGCVAPRQPERKDSGALACLLLAGN